VLSIRSEPDAHRLLHRSRLLFPSARGPRLPQTPRQGFSGRLRQQSVLEDITIQLIILLKNFNVFCLSAHGSYIGSIRIEANKPTQLPIDSQFHFGASTRVYILREKPNQKNSTIDANPEEIDSGLLGLPETETELDVSYETIGKTFCIYLMVIFVIIFRISPNIIRLRIGGSVH
jgi:hypothetical protein